MSSLPFPPAFSSSLRPPRLAAMPIEVGACLIPQAQDYLSAREMSQLRQFKHSRRQQEWFTARIAFKLLLAGSGSELSSSLPPTSCPPTFTTFQLDDIPKVPLAIYPRLESLTGGTSNQKRPQLFWQGTLLSNLHPSISHAGGWAVVGVSGSGAIGIDVEESLVRHPAFYKQYFSKRERVWIERQVRADLSPSQLYTLLWTLKESYLKTGVTSLQGFWDFSELEVDIEPTSLPAATWQPGLTTSCALQRLKLKFSHDTLGSPAQAACTIAPNLAISLVTFESSSPIESQTISKEFKPVSNPSLSPLVPSCH